MKPEAEKRGRQGTVLCLVVYAVQDGSTHVSVRPVGATMEDWINAGSSSVWTQAVKSVVVKWDGGN